jgi:hypothetical protein
MNTRVRLIDVQPGEYVYRVGTRTIDATVTAIETVERGHLVWGPRGGQYRLTAAGARAYRILVTSKSRPLVKAEAIAVVERDEQRPAPTGPGLPVQPAAPSPPPAPRPFDYVAARDREARENRRLYPKGCGLCGERAGAEMGEFWQPDKNRGVIAHAQCGLDAGLEMA